MGESLGAYVGADIGYSNRRSDVNGDGNLEISPGVSDKVASGARLFMAERPLVMGIDAGEVA